MAMRIVRHRGVNGILLATLCLLGGGAESSAQDRYRVIRTENLRREPSGRASLLATVNAGVELSGEREDGRWVQVALEGWLWAGSLDATVRDGLHGAHVQGRRGQAEQALTY